MKYAQVVVLLRTKRLKLETPLPKLKQADCLEEASTLGSWRGFQHPWRGSIPMDRKFGLVHKPKCRITWSRIYSRPRQLLSSYRPIREGELGHQLARSERQGCRSCRVRRGQQRLRSPQEEGWRLRRKGGRCLWQFSFFRGQEKVRSSQYGEKITKLTVSGLKRWTRMRSKRGLTARMDLNVADWWESINWLLLYVFTRRWACYLPCFL